MFVCWGWCNADPFLFVTNAKSKFRHVAHRAGAERGDNGHKSKY